MATLARTQSTEYFSEPDASFVAALNAAVLAGDLPPSDVSDGDDDSEDLEPPPPAQPSKKRRRYEESPEPVDEEVYGAAHFGDFGEYMQRKRAKLQIQNAEIIPQTHSQIFHGLAIYVNGQTEPPQHELRRLLVENGGIFEPYLDRKSSVTHIITDNLTNAKINEFQHMKVARPQWLTESVKAGTLLPWKDYKWTKDPALPLPQPAANVPRYAADPSNVNANRVMADPAWRAANTAAAPGYVKKYFENSRLHFLSTSKAEAQQLVREAQLQVKGRDANPGAVSPRKGKGREAERVIMHCDFDCFFVSAGLLTRPELRGKPVVVCHAQGQGGAASTSEVACASYEARKSGVRNGMSLQQARGHCPSVVTMPYDFEAYKKISLKFYTILLSRADEVEAVSIDEALIDVTEQIRAYITSPDPAKEFAERLRAEVKEATQCEISVGISHNVLLARLATRRAKPAGSVHLFPKDVEELISTLDITDLRGFAHSARDKVEAKFGSTALRDLAKKSRGQLIDALGPKTGAKLYDAIRGVDDTQLVSDRVPQSVSAELNYGIRFKTQEEADGFVMDLARDVEGRLHNAKVEGRQLTLKIMKRHPDAPIEAPKFMGHGHCEDFSKQQPLAGPNGRATSDGKVIGELACRMLASFHFDPQELRGIGIQIQKLEPTTGPVVNRQPNQQILPFHRTDVSTSHVTMKASSSKLAPPPLQPQPPKTFEADVLVPEEVDPEILEALPSSIRREIEEHQQRARSESLAPQKQPQPQPAPEARAVSKPISAAFLPPKALQRGGSRPPSGRGFARGRGRGGGGYGGGRGGGTGNRYIDKKFFESRKLRNRREQPTDAELKAMGIDLEFWEGLKKDNASKALFRDILRNQRILIAHGGRAPTPPSPKQIKPKKYEPRPDLYRHPLPRARYPEPPRLAQRIHEPVEDEQPQKKKKKTKKVFFKETDDLQDLVESWVNSFKNFPPEAQDIAFVSRFLLKAMDSKQFSDVSVERTIAIVKWWLVLLRRYWGDYEFYGSRVDEEEEGMVAEAWWKAFRDVKEQLDVIARKKWGGKLAISQTEFKMAFLGWRKWPTPILRPYWPFMVAAGVSLYGVSKLQDMAVRAPSYANDPKNPYAAAIAEEKSSAH
ncbi:hypothetical protein HMN09_00406700 [Mycena chlorophos]|uniref:DNA repair protein REV1 n=1 Tax=Mycena chlorophos TaxID=658473 RepID=A0A8H6THD8_MYCCL|nr:hypothetical protein HMN09_00406700 [Mycena chlorophos]